MIGFDIGGTKCAVCIGEEKNGVLTVTDKRVIPTDRTLSPYAVIDKLCALAEEMTSDFSRIGISCGGPLDGTRGVILSPPNLPGWDEVAIVPYLKKRYGGRVSLQNDADASALAEWKFGAGRGTQNMIFLTFGTGMGAGLILGGRLYTGASNMAGEVGHIRLSSDGPVGYGKSGSFEGFCSGGGIAEMGRAAARRAFAEGKTVSFCESVGTLSAVSAKSIAEAANAGNADAREIYRLCGEKLGVGLSILIDILNPEMIVIGSVFQRSEALLRGEMEKVLEKECLSYSKNACRIVAAALGDRLGDYAALSVAAAIGDNE